MLDVTRELYNALLQQRRDAYHLRKIRVTAKMQYVELTELRAEMPECERSIARQRTPCCIAGPGDNGILSSLQTWRGAGPPPALRAGGAGSR